VSAPLLPAGPSLEMDRAWRDDVAAYRRMTAEHAADPDAERYGLSDNQYAAYDRLAHAVAEGAVSRLDHAPEQGAGTGPAAVAAGYVQVALPVDAAAVLAGMLVPATRDEEALNAGGIYADDAVWSALRTAFPRRLFDAYVAGSAEHCDGDCEDGRHVCRYDPDAGT